MAVIKLGVHAVLGHQLMACTRLLNITLMYIADACQHDTNSDCSHGSDGGFDHHLHTHCQKHLHLLHIVGGSGDKRRGTELADLRHREVLHLGIQAFPRL